ncbi:hypothetical protein IJ579_04655 [bacterium]|nr:hypothetical protein [bacterium]
MMNTIPSNQRQEKFGNVTNRTSPDRYWITTQPQNQNSKIENNTLGATVNANIIPPIMTPEQARKTHNLKLIGISIAGATVLTAIGLVLLLKGGPKGLTKGFINLRNSLESKIQKARLENQKNPKINKTYLFLIRVIDTLLTKTEAINNFTTLKDFAFKNFMKKNSFTAGIHSKITKMFERIGRQAVVNAYEATEKSFNNTSELIKLIEKRVLSSNPNAIVEINGESKTAAQWLQKLSQMNDEIVKLYERNFNRKTLLGRYTTIKGTTHKLENDFNNRGNFWFWSKDTLNKFVAESSISEAKQALQNSVKGFRRAISYSTDDLIKDCEGYILNIAKMLGYNDTTQVGRLRLIRQNINKLVKISDIKEQKAIRDSIFKEIDEFTNEILASLKDKKMPVDVAQKMLEDILELRTMLKDFRQGQVEEILSIYKKLLSPQEYKALEKSYERAIKSMDKAIQTETEDFVSKSRDLTLGSAPTDILTVLGAFGTLGYCLKDSNSKQERQSVLLRYGIPAIAGIGTSLYCNAKLFAGTKSMIFATLSSIVVGKIGSYSDKMLKKYYLQKQA